MARKWPYCFQGHLAFPFRATRGLFSPLRRYILNKQNSLSPQTVSCLFSSLIWKGLRKGFNGVVHFRLTRRGVVPDTHLHSPQLQKANKAYTIQDYLITCCNHIYTIRTFICKKKSRFDWLLTFSLVNTHWLLECKRSHIPPKSYFYLFLVWHWWVTASDQVWFAIGQKRGIVGGREHTLVTKLSINLFFWEAAVEHTSFNLCTIFLHFTNKQKMWELTDSRWTCWS